MNRAITRIERDIDEAKAVLMAYCGQSYRSIEKVTGFSSGKISSTLHKEIDETTGKPLRTRTYRNGNGPIGSRLIASIERTPLLEVKQIQKRLTAK
jgi:hypothetical protein